MEKSQRWWKYMGTCMALILTHLSNQSYIDKKSEENVPTSMAAVGEKMTRVEQLATPSAPHKVALPW